jgi:hypothetical protein
MERRPMNWEDSPLVYWIDGDQLHTGELDDREFPAGVAVMLEVPYEDGDVLRRTGMFADDGTFAPLGRPFPGPAEAFAALQSLSTLNADGVRFAATMLDDFTTTVDEAVKAAHVLGLGRQ